MRGLITASLMVLGTYPNDNDTFIIEQGSRVRPNFSRVRLKKILSHLCDQPFEKRKKVSLLFNNLHTLGPYRGLNQSEIVKGGPPRLIGRGPDIPVCVCVCVYKCVTCAAAVREREVSN